MTRQASAPGLPPLSAGQPAPSGPLKPPPSATATVTHTRSPRCEQLCLFLHAHQLPLSDWVYGLTCAACRSCGHAGSLSLSLDFLSRAVWPWLTSLPSLSAMYNMHVCSYLLLALLVANTTLPAPGTFKTMSADGAWAAAVVLARSLALMVIF